MSSERMKRLQLLQLMPVFGGSTIDTLKFLLARADEIHLSQGDYFFHQGDRAESMFVLESGAVAVMKSSDGVSQKIRQLEQGDCFGEMALLDLYPRSSSIVAVSDCQALEIRQQALFELYEFDLEAFTMIQMNIGREISRRLRMSDEKLFEKMSR